MQLPPSAHDPSEVRDLADRILAEPRFDRPEPSLAERVQSWFAERVGDLLGQLVGTGAATVLAWAVVLGAVAAIAYLVIRHGRTVRTGWPGHAAAKVMVELSRSAAEWLAEAAALEASGRWAEGLRCRHRALVAQLVRRGVIPELPGRTAWEHQRDVAKQLPHVAPEMATATEIFERAWYGHFETGPAEAARFQELAEAVLSRPAEPEPAGR